MLFGVFGFFWKEKKPGDKRRSPKWRAFRAARIAEHPYCAACGGTKKLEAHHLRVFHKHPELELDPNNILILCDSPGRNCHFSVGHLFSWESWNESAALDAAKILYKVRTRPQ